MSAQLAAFLRRQEIRDERVLAAIAQVPRRLFVPEEVRGSAEDDRPLPVGFGQTISQLFVVAYMTERLRLSGPRPGSMVLETCRWGLARATGLGAAVGTLGGLTFGSGLGAMSGAGALIGGASAGLGAWSMLGGAYGGAIAGPLGAAGAFGAVVGAMNGAFGAWAGGLAGEGFANALAGCP